MPSLPVKNYPVADGLRRDSFTRIKQDSRGFLCFCTGEVLTTQSGFFGAYRFDDVRAGQAYILTVRARRFSFAENTRVIALFGELTDVDFTGGGSVLEIAPALSVTQ